MSKLIGPLSPNLGNDAYSTWGLAPYSGKTEKVLLGMQFVPVLNIVPGVILLGIGIAANHGTPFEKKFKATTLTNAGVVLLGLKPLGFWILDAYTTNERSKMAKQQSE